MSIKKLKKGVLLRNESSPISRIFSRSLNAAPSFINKRTSTLLIACLIGLCTGKLYSQEPKEKNKTKETAVTAETQYAIINSQKIAYRKIGTGIPIILANRFRGTLDTWDPLFLDLLAQNNTVITFDYPGIGYSGGVLPMDLKEVAAEVIKLTDHLKIDTFNIMGWSYGGFVAQYVTFLNPSRIIKSVIIGSNPVGKNEIQGEPAFLERALKPRNDFEDFVVLFFEPKSEKSKAAAKASLNRMMQRLDRFKVPSTQEIFQRYFASNAAVEQDKDNFRSAYSKIKTPLLVISGDHDISYAVENWYPLVKKASGLQILVLPEAGHAPQFQYPELTTGYINNFLKN